MKEDIIKKCKPLLVDKLRHDGENIYFYDAEKHIWSSYTGNMAAMALKKILLSINDSIIISTYEARAILTDVGCDPAFYKPLKRPAENLINCINGIVNLDTFEFQAPSPEDDFTFQLDFEYQKDARLSDCKCFTNFLYSAFGKNTTDDGLVQSKAHELSNDSSAIRLMEMLGYMVSNEYRAKKLLVILGPPNSGKSQLLELLRRVIGPSNTVALSLDDLAGHGGSRFRTELLQKAHALINDELPTKGLKNLAELKKIIAGETITVEAKGARPKTIRNTTKLLFGGNQLPELDEADCGNAFADRICPVAFKKATPSEKKDVNLANKLFAERSAIFSKALNFYGNMRKNHLAFTNDPVADEILQAYKEDNASVITFVRDNDVIKIGPGEEVHTNDLFERYQLYCDTASLSQEKSLKAFRQQLLSLPEVLGIKKKRLAGDKNPCSVVLGVSLIS